MKYVLTGASGFIGRALSGHLLQLGQEVTGLARENSGAFHPGVRRIVVADEDYVGLPALREANAVVHLGARAHVTNDPKAERLARFRASNAEPTRRLATACVEARVPVFVLMSSIGAVRSASTAAITDTTTPEPDTAYGISKLECEDISRSIMADSPTRWIAVRPPMVYGPNMKGNARRAFDAVARGLLLPTALLSNRRSMIFIDNLLRVLVVLATTEAARGTYVVADPEAPSVADFFREIAAALHRPLRTLPIPASVLRSVGRVGDIANRLGLPGVGSETVERLTEPLVIEPTRLQRELGCRSAVSLREGLAATADWYTHQRVTA